MAQAIDRWKEISATSGYPFESYASFMLAYPGFPDEAKMRGFAEASLERETVDPARLVAYFDRFKPLTNPARAQYALALSSLRRGDARDEALAAWRGGAMSDVSAAALYSLYGSTFSPADHDARMDALLWAGAASQAQQQIVRVSSGARDAFTARLAALQGLSPEAAGIAESSAMLRDTGYIYNRVRQLRRSGATGAAIRLLAARPPANVRPVDPTKWVGELLSVAKGADAFNAVAIAASIDDAFEPGADISRAGFKLRDDYTSLMWLGGTRALEQLRNGPQAAQLFYRYGAAARTPQTRSKGFYWAGRAMAQRGDASGAARYFEMAAAYPDQFYGMLALERLSRPLPAFNRSPSGLITPAERQAFNARPLTHAVREVSRDFEWRTSVRFFREISDQAESEGDHLLVAELARTLGRRDLAVILGQSAHADGFGDFQTVSFPLVPNPPGTDWTVVHAITRQESQFAMNAVSHAGARGLMQLMPGTAREQAGLLGLSYDPAALTRDAGYNIRLGDAYFARMMDTYQGSYPLAVAAYNAGPGNVNRWLRSNGDPRYGSVDWIDWIEAIPLSETRNYVQRVLENAVVYEAMNPNRASYRGANPLSHFLGKRYPG
jgi:soluble lytic murein transglycosylase